ncbi:MAG: YciI family protein [Flavobacterium sp.]|uniref:YciI family protein n=1 Tax=Flavobacterium sp. TaxID=239 RepID=UPI0022BC2426|nr:YciI family protein [Flavobacterium sp.]MCZ8197890.1 YciI family protein [Flavobacterium sp.]
METKKEFMLLFRYEPTNDYVPTQSEMDEMQQSWGSFIGNIAIQEKLVSTHQLGFEGNQIFADKKSSNGIYLSNNQTVAGNMIVKANSINEATEIAKNCPILNIGGNVEVRSIQPM